MLFSVINKQLGFNLNYKFLKNYKLVKNIYFEKDNPFISGAPGIIILSLITPVLSTTVIIPSVLTLENSYLATYNLSDCETAIAVGPNLPANSIKVLKIIKFKNR